ncbi:hypothetical protein BCR33DRAFT_501838 [Rhizoclosmatium globosum]|uniref:Uncharacterized protein n=1 Tax=Rhizoclosmatium globosum TaxID=329046 RepID=A0A1Y2CVK0_9FUNG|nr:hypothetical protein BCR33DRAFT_501838 [Rhizoclosmatium globosum]|eukprot:ORY51051.1 hypothetical protein BCR33DRAFT_501838 [Rhizoclosmatium globosum]
MFSTRRKKEVLPYSAFSAPPSVPQPSDAAKANRRISMFFGAGNDLSDAQTASASPAQKLKNFIKRSKSKWTLRKDGEDSFGGAKLQTQIYLDAPLGYSHSQQQSYAHTQCLNTGTQSWKPHEHPIASQNNSFTHTFNHRPSTPHTPDLMRSSYATSSDSRPVSSSDLYK